MALKTTNIRVNPKNITSTRLSISLKIANHTSIYLKISDRSFRAMQNVIITDQFVSDAKS